MSDQLHREQFMQRLYGMAPASNTTMMAELAKQNDWWRICKACGVRIVGTMEQVRKPCSCNDQKG